MPTLEPPWARAFVFGMRKDPERETAPDSYLKCIPTFDAPSTGPAPKRMPAGRPATNGW